MVDSTSVSCTDLYLARTIHPVGQGAFYCETFSGEGLEHPCFTAVYDCGGNKLHCKTEIEALNRLDILFISHFHDDHINCVMDLKAINPRAFVIIPGVSHCRFAADLIANFLRTGAVSPSILFMIGCIPALKTPGTSPKHFSIQIGQDFMGKSCGLTL